jgi:hypothetical protein
MRCERVRELLVEFEDTALPDDVAEHMDRCSSCSRHSLRMKTVRRLMSLKKYECPDPGFQERSALAIHRRIEDLNRQPESRLGRFWEFLTDYPQAPFRYALAAMVVALLVINFISMPQLTPIRLAEPVVRLTPPSVPASNMISFDIYRQSAIAELQNHSNQGPTRIEYGPRKSVPVTFEY